jgi:DNA anti-recombination protein RmuC
LKATGLPDKQAEALAAAFADLVQVNFKELATKEEYDRGVKELQGKIDRVATEFRAEINQIAKELDAKIDRIAKEAKDALEQAVKELKRVNADLRTELKHEMQTMQARHQADILLLKWMAGVSITGVAAIRGLIARIMFIFPR